MRLQAAAIGLAITLLGACGKGDDPRRGVDGGVPCANDMDCNDGIPCTVDSCGVTETCTFSPIDERCGAGTICDPASGCVAEMECTTDADCDDTFMCTFDACGVGGVCNHMPLDELCGAGQMCDPMTGCTGAMGCTTDGECDDSIACTIDTCGVSMTCTNMPVDTLCTGTDERCVPRIGCHVPMPCTTAAECDDGDFCNGAEVCMPEFGCTPAAAPRMCDDSDDCTLDSCDTTSDMCVFACDTSRSECDCPVAGPTCSGTFSVSPPFTYSCSEVLFGSVVVNVNFSTVTFTNRGLALEVRPASAHFSAALADSTAPVCPNFEASHEVGGGCVETYGLMGTFTNDNSFMGMLSTQFRDENPAMPQCGLTTCINQNVMVTGTRM